MSELGLLLQRFLRGHPRAFGALLLVIGLLQVAFGVIFYLAPCVFRDNRGVHFYSAALLIFSGILTLAADKANNLALVKTCLVMYIICAVVVAVINIFYLIDLLYDQTYRYRCSNTGDGHCQSLRLIFHYCSGMRGILLVLTSLGFFICISMAAFGCKAVCRKTTDDELTVAVSGDFHISSGVNEGSQPVSVAAGPESSPPEETAPYRGSLAETSDSPLT